MDSSEESGREEVRHDSCSDAGEEMGDNSSPQPETAPDALAEILDVKEEEDPVVQAAANEAGAALLCFIGSYAPTRVSPVEEVRPVIGLYDEFAIEAAINAIRTSRPELKRLYVLVNSTGGSMSASYKVARAIRKSFSDITTFIPHIAASGGTLIALTGDRLVMGLMSQLSPLDPQTIYRGTSISTTAYLKAFARSCKWFEKKTPDEVPYPKKALTDKLDLLIMEDFNSRIRLAVEYVANILELGGQDEQQARETATQLVSGFTAHDEVLHPHDLQELNLSIKPADSEEYRAMWNVMKHWLAKYMREEIPVTIIRYRVPDESEGQTPKEENL